MNLSRKIAEAVESLPTDLSLPRWIEAEADNARIAVQLSSRGTLGLAFDLIDFDRYDRDELTTDQLRAWGNTLAARVNYLMEPLIVLEVDAEAGEAELRSKTPTPKGDRRSFYQIRLEAQGSLHLERIAFDETTRARQIVPFQMTLEVLERLTDDLVASLA
jgi:hypothetical protein